jgi:multiple sugar transport system permease protein
MRQATTAAPGAAAKANQATSTAIGPAARRWILTVVLLVIGVLWTLPSLWALVTSLKQTPAIFKLPPLWIPAPITLDQYLAIFSNDRSTDIARSLLNSVVYAVLSTVLVVLISALAAYPLARMKFPGRDVVFWSIVGSLMVPGVINIVPLYLLMYSFGWISTYQALVVPQLASAFGVFLLRQFFLSLPSELEDAARIDGANSWDTFRRILLPLSQAALGTLAILTFQWSWNDFTWPLIILNQQSMFTLPVALSLLQTAYSATSYGPIMAGAVVSALPLLLVFLLANRQIVEGVKLSGLKT